MHCAVAFGIYLLGCASGQVAPPAEKLDAAGKDTAPGSSSDTNRKDDGSTCTPFVPPAGSCDPLTNDGCPSDQKCTALRDGNTLSLGCGNRSDSGTGEKGENDDCQPVPDTGRQTGDDCGNGLACFNWAGESPKCHRLCAHSGCSRDCADGWACNRQLPGIEGYWSCGVSCRPLDQTGCQPDEGCYVASSGPTCAQAGSKATGEECDPSKVNDCVAGSTCITGLSNGNRCLAFCSTSGGSPGCSTTCIKMPVDDALMSESDVGYCR
jgi:hypothetical protein